MRGVEHAGDAGLFFVELLPPQVDVEEAAAAATLESDALLPDEAARITVGFFPVEVQPGPVGPVRLENRPCLRLVQQPGGAHSHGRIRSLT